MGRGVIIAIDDPNVVILIDVNIHRLLHAPFVGQRLGPKWVNPVNGSLLGGCGPSHNGEEQHRDGDAHRSIGEPHGGLFLMLKSMKSE
jgi:hypothetical protein